MCGYVTFLPPPSAPKSFVYPGSRPPYPEQTSLGAPDPIRRSTNGWELEPQITRHPPSLQEGCDAIVAMDSETKPGITMIDKL
jgi:hypothetical protein